MNSEIKKHIQARDTWLRGLFILIFAVIYGVAEVVAVVVVLFQFISSLFTGQTNDRLLQFGRSLSAFVYEIMMYVTYNAATKPFPFSPWPNSDPSVTQIDSGPSGY